LLEGGNASPFIAVVKKEEKFDPGVVANLKRLVDDLTGAVNSRR
jgi:hypothetical protein